MNKDKANTPLTLEHIIPVEDGKYVFLYGLDKNNNMVYCFSDNPEVFFYHKLIREKNWVLLGDTKLPLIYFSKYLKNQT